ncbi:MAG: DUF805 domain-containing protein [Pseudomonadota bacterium]
MSDIAEENTYRTPEANVDPTLGDQYCDVKLFSTQGRLGRVRHIAYGVGSTVLASVLLALPTLVTGATEAGAGILNTAYTALVTVAMFVLQIMWTIRRCHDFNTTGWLAVLMFIPLVSLIFWFIPGTHGRNDYGNPPPPNGGGVIAVALLVPLLFFGGMLAAIVVPAYSDYTERAQVSEAFTLAAGAQTTVAEFVQLNGRYPSAMDLRELELGRGSVRGEYSAVEVAAGTGEITVTMTPAAGPNITGGRIIFTPPSLENLNGTFTFFCMSPDIEDRFLPRSCQSGN